MDESYGAGLTFVVSKGGNIMKHNNQENAAITSTPQKTESMHYNKIQCVGFVVKNDYWAFIMITDKLLTDKIEKPRNEISFMGQGDEELELVSKTINKIIHFLEI